MILCLIIPYFSVLMWFNVFLLFTLEQTVGFNGYQIKNTKQELGHTLKENSTNRQDLHENHNIFTSFFVNSTKICYKAQTSQTRLGKAKVSQQKQIWTPQIIQYKTEQLVKELSWSIYRSTSKDSLVSSFVT